MKIKLTPDKDIRIQKILVGNVPVAGDEAALLRYSSYLQFEELTMCSAKRVCEKKDLTPGRFSDILPSAAGIGRSKTA